MRKYKIAVLGMLFFLGSNSRADEIVDPLPEICRPVLRIEASGCGPNKQRPQTLSGFLMERNGRPGVVTALHGIAGCKRIKARGDGVWLDSLEPEEYDLKRDVAWLPLKTSVGMQLAFLKSSKDYGEKLRVLGFPLGIMTPWIVDLRQNGRVPLKKLVTADFRGWQALHHRKSPDLDTVVIGLSGDLQPGHSGAPIVNADGLVVAVANGGLREGTAGIGWGVLMTDITWSSKESVGPALLVLAQDDAALSFSLESVYDGSLGLADLASEQDAAIESALLKVRQCKDEFHCHVAERELDNLKNRWESALRLAVSILDKLSPVRWSHSESDWSNNSEGMRKFYEQNLGSASMLFGQLDTLTFRFGRVRLVEAVRQAKTEFDVAFVSAPEKCWFLTPMPSSPICLSKDFKERRAAVVEARRAVSALCIRLGIAL